MKKENLLVFIPIFPLIFRAFFLDKALNILKVISNTSWGASRTSLLRVYRASILSKIDYGCVTYGSARQSVLKRLDPIHHSALRLCSGAFRTSPVESLYVECCEPSLHHRRRILTPHYYFKILSLPGHPFFKYKESQFIIRLQRARPSVIPSFFTRAAELLRNLNLEDLQVVPNLKHHLTPWKSHGLKFLNPFKTFDKAHTAPEVYQQLFADHRDIYHNFIPIFQMAQKALFPLPLLVLLSILLSHFNFTHLAPFLQRKSPPSSMRCIKFLVVHQITISFIPIR
ncbi:hypothetical protein AVEN_30967-1 [Araneus ventricosus]|uniref:Uncharacterized protein n=1 Tax=Araneus ventricosus TaxID=182803 RepID=A0A4Y2M0J1_ARAVE|nr:hypothetical protein AVEN_30967-1 [Araneus ventricosus]